MFKTSWADALGSCTMHIRFPETHGMILDICGSWNTWDDTWHLRVMKHTVWYLTFAGHETHGMMLDICGSWNTHDTWHLRVMKHTGWYLTFAGHETHGMILDICGSWNTWYDTSTSGLYIEHEDDTSGSNTKHVGWYCRFIHKTRGMIHQVQR